MGGPRITTGSNSKQHYKTPADFMKAVERKHGDVFFDLAADASNHQVPRYFAPREFEQKLEFDEVTTDEIRATGDSLLVRGAAQNDVDVFVQTALVDHALAAAGGLRKATYTIANSDSRAAGFDAFSHDWSKINGLCWLNCNFNACEMWADRCVVEAKKGANILLLTPLTMTVWARDLVLPNSDVSMLSGRLCFDGVSVFPKDCMLSLFGPAKKETFVETWEWRTGRVHNRWRIVKERENKLDSIINEGRRGLLGKKV